MAVVKKINSKRPIEEAFRYVTNPKKTGNGRLVGVHNCSDIENAVEEMQGVKIVWGKTDGRMYMHFSQSFKPGETDTEIARSIAERFCEAPFFKGFQIIYGTHADKRHIHNHFIVNSVNMDDGHKIHMSMEDLQGLRNYSDRLCRDFGLSVIETKKGEGELSTNTYKKYAAIERAKKGEYKSYVLDCYTAVKEAAAEAVSRDDFIDRLSRTGYKTVWSESKKHITFENADGKKIRAANLEKTFGEPFGKDSLRLLFEQNAERLREEERRRKEEESSRQREAEREKQDGGLNPELEMTADKLDIEAVIKDAKKVLESDKGDAR
jgi:hypothetical protein